jgi:hypothetical protein
MNSPSSFFRVSTVAFGDAETDGRAIGKITAAARRTAAKYR